MFCGRLTDAQRNALAPHATAAVVAYDLGAGNGAMARELLAAGARFVVAVEKEELRRGAQRDRDGRIEWHPAYFAEYLARAPSVIPLALVSWPVQTPTPGLAALCARANVVAYLGKNTDHTACGDRALFEHLARRPVLAEVRDRRNDLVVYGRGVVKRPLLAEEIGALCDEPLEWETAGRIARVVAPTLQHFTQQTEKPR